MYLDILWQNIVFIVVGKKLFLLFGEQGWRSGESTRLQPMWPEFESRHQRHVGWVCCWLSPLLWEVFLRLLRFSPLLKNQHFQIPIRSGTHGHVSTSCYKLLSAPWVNKLQFTNLQFQFSSCNIFFIDFFKTIKGINCKR